jgi:hypothetical protein
MSNAQPSNNAGQGRKRKWSLAVAGVALLAAVCASLVVMSAVEIVRDSADRTH